MSDPMPNVAWKTHPVHTDYQASTDGRVRSLDRVVWVGNGTGVKSPKSFPGREFSLFIVGKGYLAFDIRKRKTRVHVFVCEVFHGLAPTPQHEVRHLNGTSTDNRPENLCWGTSSENARDRIRHGRQWSGSKPRPRSRTRATRCINGHEFTDANTRIVVSDGSRCCRVCDRAAQRRAYRRMRDKLARQSG